MESGFAAALERQKEEFATERRRQQAEHERLRGELVELRRQGEENNAQFISLLKTSGLVLVSLSIWVVDPFGTKHQFMQVPSSPEVSPTARVSESIPTPI